MKHLVEKVHIPSTAETTRISSSKKPKHSSSQAAKPTEKVSFLSSFIVCIVLFLFVDQFHS